MKSEELNLLKEKVYQLKHERDSILKIQNEIKKLEETDDVKKYLKLLELLNNKRNGTYKDIYKFTDKKIISIALNNTKITPDDDIYVYLGTYKYSNDIDAAYGSYDIPVNRENVDADYVLYQNLEAKDYETLQIPYDKADEFELTHKIIFPKNVTSRQRYFYELQSKYFETMILESPEKAKENVKKLVRIKNDK